MKEEGQRVTAREGGVRTGAEVGVMWLPAGPECEEIMWPLEAGEGKEQTLQQILQKEQTCWHFKASTLRSILDFWPPEL